MWPSRWRQRVRGLLGNYLLRSTLSWPCHGWFLDTKPSPETKDASLLISLKSFALSPMISEQYAGTVEGTKSLFDCYHVLLDWGKGTLDPLFLLVSEVSGFLGNVLRIWSISGVTLELISIINTFGPFLISHIWCLTPSTSGLSWWCS